MKPSISLLFWGLTLPQTLTIKIHLDTGFDGQIVGKNNNFWNIFLENIIRESVQNIIFLFKLNFYCQ